jgi:tetratricopeptide (TPR) repeat protein
MLQEDTVKRMAKNQDLGETHPDTLEAMDHYGVTLGSFLQLQESLEIHLKVLKLRTKVIQVLRRDTLSGMHQENSRPATTNSASTVEETTYPTNSRDQDQNLILDRLSTLQNLAMVQLDLWLSSGSPDNLDLLQAAQKNMNGVLERRKQLLGEEHPWTLWAVCNLVKVNTELGLLEESEKMLLKGIPAAQRSLGDNHPRVLMSMGELAKAYSRQKRYDEAEKKIKEVVEKLDESRGEDHLDTVFATFRLSNLYKREGKIEEAANACENALRKGDMRLTRRYPLCQKIAKELENLQRMLPPGRRLSNPVARRNEGGS